MTPVPSRNGFTLIELLVSLALMAMAAGLLVAALSTASRVGARTMGAVNGSEAVGAAQALLRARLQSMSAEARFDASAPYADVRGDAFRFSFTAPAADAERPAPLRRYRLMLSRGTVMLLSVDPLRRDVQSDAPAINGWNSAPLLRDATTLSIAYFGVGPPDNERRWRNFWQDRPTLPELIRVRVSFAPGDPRVWPDLIVRPAASVSTACQLDANTGKCRAAAS